MNFEDITKGMEVTINTVCNSTKMSFGLNEAMRKMLGTCVKVDRAVGSDTVIIKCQHGTGWSWHPNDLTPTKDFKYTEFNSEPTEPPETFNPDQLIID